MPSSSKKNTSGYEIERRNNNIQRKRKFTHSNRRIIYEALRSELPISKAVKLVGIDRSTFYRWMEKGQDDIYPVHMRFRKKVNRILAKIEAEKLKIIHDAAIGNHSVINLKIRRKKKGDRSIEITIKQKSANWKAAAWFLEHRFPKEYGRKRDNDKEATKSPDEIAAEIKKAIDAIEQTVPVVPS